MADNIGRLQAALADRYRIEGELGQGGMATVYLAEDLKHDRKVAVKVLRPELAAVIGAERFLAEIKTTANLQHPHILPLHDSGEADSFLYYVMPYVEGESLRDRLKRDKQLPIKETVRISCEVADALDYAHRHGIIHRDIKPENVLLHDGRALVADFGIALAATSAGSRMTETGMSLGTPHYMSPEQAMGERDLSPRSDIYALGAMTYEMLVGDPPFTGSTAQAIVAKVMTDRPAPLSRQRDTVPEEVENAVLTALEKLPADRFETAAELAQALRGETATSSRRPRAKAVPATSRLWWPALFAAATVAALWGWLRPVPQQPQQPGTRLALLAPSLGGVSTASMRQIALTPDGSTVLYNSVFPDGFNYPMKHRLDGTEPNAIPSSWTFVAGFNVSPDGKKFLAVHDTRERMFVFPIDGNGGGEEIDGDIVPTEYAAWAPDGSLWFSASDGSDPGIARLAPDGSISRPFGTDHNLLRIQQFLPGGRKMIVVDAPTAVGTLAGSVALLDVASGELETLISQNVIEARYTAGHLVYVLPDGTMHAVPLDHRTGKVTRASVQIASGVSLAGTGVAQFAVADNGTVVYIPEEQRSLVMVGMDGSRRPLTEQRRNFHAPQFSPDGRQVSIDFDSNDGRDVWILALDGGTLSRATFDGDGHDAIWAPDGRSLAYLASRGSHLGVFQTRPGGGEPAESLMASLNLRGITGWLEGGSGLVAVASDLGPSAPPDIDQVDIGLLTNRDGAWKLEPVAATRYRESFPAPSPDGRWLGFVSDLSGRNEIYLRRLDGGPRVQVSLEGGTEPVWDNDGSRLFYRTVTETGSDLVSATIDLRGAPRIVSRQTLFAVNDIASATPHANYDLAPDGTGFVMVQRNPVSRVMVIENLPSLVKTLSDPLE